MGAASQPNLSPRINGEWSRRSAAGEIAAANIQLLHLLAMGFVEVETMRKKITRLEHKLFEAQPGEVSDE